MDAVAAYASAHPLGIPAGLGFLFLIGLVILVIRARELTRNLSTASASLAVWEPETPTEREHDVCRFVRAYLVGVPPVQLPSWSAPRVLLSKEIEEILDNYVEKRTATLRFVVGPLATAVALVFTFFLIAHVLQNDVHEAVKGAASAGTEGSSHLATAVQTLGVKFYISASGIVGSIVFAMTTPWLKKEMYRAAHTTAERTAPHFCTPAILSALAQEELLRETHGARARDEQRDARERVRDARREHEMNALTTLLADVQLTLKQTREDLEKLKSIEVSVKDLGAEVTTQLRHMLKDDLGEQMKELVVEIMTRVESLSQDLQTKILGGLQQAMEAEIPRILESLTAIQRSVEGQAQSPVERLLEQLQGVVAGGLRGESAQMTTAIRQFSEVVPALAEQLRATAENLTTDMRSRTDENVRASEALVSQVASLLGRLETQQAATEQLVDRIGAATTASAEALVQKVHSESETLFAGLMKTSREDVDAMLSRLREATTANATTYTTLEASVSATSHAILSARDGLQESADAIRRLSADSKTVMSEARQAHEVAQRASSAFDNSATQLRQGVEAMRQAVDGARTHAKEQGVLLEQHRRALQELEKLWPTLFDAYLRNFDEKSKKLLESWDVFHQKTTQFSETVGSSLADAAEELKLSVDQLATLHKERRA